MLWEIHLYVYRRALIVLLPIIILTFRNTMIQRIELRKNFTLANAVTIYGDVWTANMLRQNLVSFDTWRQNHLLIDVCPIIAWLSQ